MASNRKRLDKRALTVLSVVLALEVLLCAGIAMTVHTKKSALEQTLQSKETTLSNVRTVSAGLPGLQREYEKMQAQVSRLEQGLPTPEYIPTLLSDVEATAIASGVKIQEFRPKQPAANGAQGTQAGDSSANDSSETHFDMTVAGRYGQIQNFMKSLTRFGKILAIDSVKLQPTAANAKTGVSPVLTATFNMTAFMLPQAATTTPSAPAGATASTTAEAATPAANKLAAGQTTAPASAQPRG